MIPKIQDIDVNKKTVIVRFDLNVPMVNGEVSDISRIKSIKKTLNYLVDNGAKPIIMSHLGRPKGKVNKNLSLSNIQKSLENETKFSFKLLKNFINLNIENELNILKKNEILLLENLRFFKEEEENNVEFSKKLSSFSDIYCNDAFSVSHRSHSSTVGITNFIPGYAGFSLQSEIKELEFFLNNPNNPIVALVGGAKVSTKLELLSSLIQKIDHLVIGGGMANTFLHAINKNIGKSLCEYEMRDIAIDVINSAKKNQCQIHLPEDIVCAKSLSNNIKCKIYDVDNCPDEEIILDAGPKTIRKIKNVFDRCKTLIWNGPLGAFEITPFDKATIEISKYAAKLTQSKKIRTIAGGGDTISALNKALVTNDFSYVSTSGGAFLEWLEGKELPGLLALKTTNK